MRVVYVNHTSVVSGAEFALLDLMRALPEEVEPLLLCPAGELAELSRAAGLRVKHIHGTDMSLKLSPKRLIEGLWDLALAGVSLRRALRRSEAQVIHANSIRAGVLVTAARPGRRVPLVLHIHDALPSSRLTRTIRRILLRRSSALIAVSRFVRDRFLEGSKRPPVPFPVLYNPVDGRKFTPTPREEARREFGAQQAGARIGVIAQITPWKGQDTAVRALAILRREFPDIELWLVGEPRFIGKATRFDNLAFQRELERLIQDEDLDRFVRFWGQRSDVPVLLAALDVLLVPSWEEPLGRTMLESMLVGTPVVATAVGGPAELIEDGVNGRLAPPGEPSRWAEAVREILIDPPARERMTEQARALVLQRFDSTEVATQTVEVYHQVLQANQA